MKEDQESFFGNLIIAVFCTFLALKIMHKIEWNWFWVFSPLWIIAILCLIPIIIDVVEDYKFQKMKRKWDKEHKNS